MRYARVTLLLILRTIFLIEAVRELIRFLRRDDETHEIRRYLGTAKILEKDLVPILIHRHSNEEILDLLLRLVFIIITAKRYVTQLTTPIS